MKTAPIIAVVAAVGSALLAVACSPDRSAKTPPMPSDTSDPSYAGDVVVRDFAPDGTLAPARARPKIVKSDAEWRRLLSPEAYVVARGKGTERPFCGVFHDNHQVGTYVCACCRLPLFRSDAKFDSGTGWPSFFQPVAKENVAFVEDRSHGMVRTEILCRRCDGHLGHVFDDGPRPTGLRFCLNSVSLDFVPDAPAAKTGGK